MDILTGLVSGLVFGFLLQKGRVLRYEKQLGALRLMDMTIIKFMMTAILVGMVGIYLIEDFSSESVLSLKSTVIGSNLIGGLLFGVGWGLFGLCPGTAIGALGEGRWHALFGIVGMLVGASLYAALYPLMLETVMQWGVFEDPKMTLPGVLGVNHWIVIVVMIVGVLALFRWFERIKI
jgi:uncharacterized protein